MKSKTILRRGVILLAGVIAATTFTGCSWNHLGLNLDYDKLEKTDFSSAKEIKADKASLDGIEDLKLIGMPLKDTDGHMIAVLMKVEESPDSELHYAVKTNSKIADSELPTLQKEGSTLTLGGNKNAKHNSLNIANDRAALFTVQMPKDYQKELGIELDACSFHADQLQAGKFSLELNAGHVKIGDFSGKGKVVVDAGQAEIGSFTGGGSVEVNAGQVNVDKMILKDDLSLEVNAGQMNCAMAPDSKFRFQGEASAGSLKTYFATETQGGNMNKKLSATVNGGSDYTVNAEVNAGQMNLKKA